MTDKAPTTEPEYHWMPGDGPPDDFADDPRPDKAPTTEPRTEAGKALHDRLANHGLDFDRSILAIEADAYMEGWLAGHKQGQAEATASVIQRVGALRALIGPLDPSCAKARAETLDAVLAILRGDSR